MAPLLRTSNPDVQSGKEGNAMAPLEPHHFVVSAVDGDPTMLWLPLCSQRAYAPTSCRHEHYPSACPPHTAIYNSEWLPRLTAFRPWLSASAAFVPLALVLKLHLFGHLFWCATSLRPVFDLLVVSLDCP